MDYGKKHRGDTTTAPRRGTTGSQKLPPGTGPGTSGKPVSDYDADYDIVRDQGMSLPT